MPSVVVQVCVDPRLSHDLLRSQVRQRLTRLRLSADMIYLVGEPGGNLGTAFEHTLDLVQRRHDPVVLCAVLYHDDCIAAGLGLRAPLETTAGQLDALLSRRRIHCPVLSGSIRTANNHLTWTDEPPRRRSPFTLGH